MPRPRAPPPLFTKFLDLPGEIRNRIYTLLLIDPHGLLLGLSRGTAQNAGLPPHMTTWLNDNRQRLHVSQLLSLSLVSRQIRHETRTLFFGCNRFIFPSIRALVAFTQKMPQEVLDLITKVDTKAHRPDAAAIYSDLGGLACLARFSKLRRFYMSCWMHCARQEVMSGLLDKYLGDLGPQVQGVVELGYCWHCQEGDGMVEGREWWIWVRERDGRKWDVVVRRGDAEIEVVGRRMRGRPQPPEWALGKLPRG